MLKRTKLKISKALAGKKRNYYSPGMKGKKHSDLSKEKIRIAHKKENLSNGLEI